MKKNSIEKMNDEILGKSVLTSEYQAMNEKASERLKMNKAINGTICTYYNYKHYFGGISLAPDDIRNKMWESYWHIGSKKYSRIKRIKQ